MLISELDMIDATPTFRLDWKCRALAGHPHRRRSWHGPPAARPFAGRNRCASICTCTRQEERDDVTLSRNVLPWGGGVDDVVENNARPIGLQVGEQLAAGRQLIRAHDIIDNE